MGKVNRPWSDAEDAFLRRYYSTLGVSETARRLRRPRASIIYRAHRLRVGKHNASGVCSCGDLAWVLLGAGHFTVLDPPDLERVADLKWHRTTAGYARSSSAGLMHRLLVPTGGPIVDHANRDRLDNRRRNLRPCSWSNNATNSNHPRGRTGFRGVTPCRRRFKATISAGSVSQYLGLYSTPEEAARAYDRAARSLHGDFAILNFAE